MHAASWAPCNRPAPAHPPTPLNNPTALLRPAPPPNLPACLQGYLTGLGGNSLLLSYFAAKREMNAVVVQALGIASSFAVLTQIRAAGFMPRSVYAALAAVVGLQVRPPPPFDSPLRLLRCPGRR